MTNKIQHIIAIASGKGGVGKSTVTNNLAIALSKMGLKIGVLDADIYGPSQPAMFGATAEKVGVNQSGQIVPLKFAGIQFVSVANIMAEDATTIWRAPIANQFISEFLNNVAWDALDFLLLDLPPGTGDIQLTICQQARLSGAVIVTTPQNIAVKIAEKGLRMFQQVNVPILGVVENMSGYICTECGHKNHIFQEGGAQGLADKYSTKVLVQIPLDANIVRCGDRGESLLDSVPTSVAAARYRELAKALEAVAVRQAESNNEPTNIEIVNGDLTVAWPEQQETFTAYELRAACRCAGCVDENSGKQILQIESIPLDITIKSHDLVGRYGVKLDFSDGHNTGIYSFVLLKKLSESKAAESSFEV